MSRYRLLAIDIDGTLVNSQDQLTSATRAALGRAIDAGIRVVLATGRRYSRALPLVEPLALDVPLVTASGALIKDPLDHRTLFCAEYNPGVLAGALRIVDTAGLRTVALCRYLRPGIRLLLPAHRARTAGAGGILPHESRLSSFAAHAGRRSAAGRLFLLCHGDAPEMVTLQAELERAAIRMICTSTCCAVRAMWATCAKSLLRA